VFGAQVQCIAAIKPAGAYATEYFNLMGVDASNRDAVIEFIGDREVNSASLISALQKDPPLFHHFTFTLFGRDIYVHTNTWMMAIFAIGGVVAFTLMFRRERMMMRAFALALVSAISAFYGARLFHLIFERSTSVFTLEDLTHFDGMTFYGSLIAGVAVAVLGTSLLFPRSSWFKILDLASLTSAFGYGFLRIGCFANGCCWGRLTAVPWAVVYGPGSEMPYIGLPVHPVQLYDAFCGFLVFTILVIVYRKRYVGLGMPIFLVLSSVGRFITEFYRGDAYRGTNVMFHLSTSQSIAVVLFLVGLIWTFLYFKEPALNASQESRA
jgi:phosphatidylglycerol:prolipoprotein diacylglycerol transferase